MDVGHSYEIGKKSLQQWIWVHFPKNSKILDLGCGKGTYVDLLGKDSYIYDGVDVYEPIVPFIINKYHTVYCMNIKDFPYLNNYDLIILGDTLEHLTIDDAKYVIEQALHHCKYLLVAVPFEYQQGPIEDNNFEEHLQPDLNFYTMKERYPQLDLLLYVESDQYAVYCQDPDRPYLLKAGFYIGKGDLYE